MQTALLRLLCSAGVVYISKPPPTHTLTYNILKYNTSSAAVLIVTSFFLCMEHSATESKTAAVFFSWHDSSWVPKQRPERQ